MNVVAQVEKDKRVRGRPVGEKFVATDCIDLASVFRTCSRRRRSAGPDRSGRAALEGLDPRTGEELFD